MSTTPLRPTFEDRVSLALEAIAISEQVRGTCQTEASRGVHLAERDVRAALLFATSGTDAARRLANSSLVRLIGADLQGRQVQEYRRTLAGYVDLLTTGLREPHPTEPQPEPEFVEATYPTIEAANATDAVEAARRCQGQTGKACNCGNSREVEIVGYACGHLLQTITSCGHNWMRIEAAGTCSTCDATVAAYLDEVA